MTLTALIIQNSNLQQAFEMSIYTWSAAVILGLCVWLFAQFILKTNLQRLKLYTVVACSTGVYTMMTGTLWFYYFAILLCLPFFVLLLFFTWQLFKLDSKALGTRIARGLVVSTIVMSVLAAWFFGMLF